VWLNLARVWLYCAELCLSECVYCTLAGVCVFAGRLSVCAVLSPPPGQPERQVEPVVGDAG